MQCFYVAIVALEDFGLFYIIKDIYLNQPTGNNVEVSAIIIAKRLNRIVIMFLVVKGIPSSKKITYCFDTIV
jgi:hypothetical protein